MSFQALKQRVIELPIWALPDFNKAFQVECDANGSVIGVNNESRRKTCCFL